MCQNVCHLENWNGYCLKYWQIYSILALALFAVFWPAIAEHSRVVEAREARIRMLTPILSRDEITSRLNFIRKAYASPASSDPKEYPRILEIVYETQQIAHKSLPGVNGEDAGTLGQADYYVVSAAHLTEKYREVHGDKVIHALMQKTENKIKRFEWPRSFPDLTHEKFSELFFIGYLQSTMIAVLFFATQLRRKGLTVWVETWRIIPLAFVWPVAFWHYPERVSLVDQMRRAQEFIAYLFTTIISCCAMGGVANAGEKKEDKGGAVATFGMGTESKKVLANGKSACDAPIAWGEGTIRLGGGFALNIWGSRALDASKSAADEVSYTFSWTRAVQSLGAKVGAGISYFDIGEIGTSAGNGGDRIRAYVSINKPMSREGSAHSPYIFGKAEKLFVVGTEGHGGWNARIGAGNSWDLGHNFRIDQSLAIVGSGGPLDAPDGAMLRYEVGLLRKFTEGVTLTLLSFKAFMPFVGMEGRDEDKFVFGAGLSFAF